MKINDLKKVLKDSTQADLIRTIADLYKKNDFVKDYCISKYSESDGSEVLDKHKNIIENEFFPVRGDGRGRLSVAKKSISEFKKLSDDKLSIAELMIFYVEIGIKYTVCYGDIDGPFYFSMESMYGNALQYIFKNGFVEIFNQRCLDIVNDTADMGWGFHDGLSESYYSYYE